VNEAGPGCGSSKERRIGIALLQPRQGRHRVAHGAVGYSMPPLTGLREGVRLSKTVLTNGGLWTFETGHDAKD